MRAAARCRDAMNTAPIAERQPDADAVRAQVERMTASTVFAIRRSSPRS